MNLHNTLFVFVRTTQQIIFNSVNIVIKISTRGKSLIMKPSPSLMSDN